MCITSAGAAWAQIFPAPDCRLGKKNALTVSANCSVVYLWDTLFHMSRVLLAFFGATVKTQPRSSGFWWTAKCSCVLGMSLKLKVVLGDSHKPARAIPYFICSPSEAVSPRSHSNESAKETQESSLQELRSSFASCSP